MPGVWDVARTRLLWRCALFFVLSVGGAAAHARLPIGPPLFSATRCIRRSHHASSACSAGQRAQVLDIRGSYLTRVQTQGHANFGGPRLPEYGPKHVIVAALVAFASVVVAVADPHSTQPHRHAAVNSRRAWAGINGVHALLAEDHDVVRAVVTEVIRRSGGTCDAVADGLSAVEAALTRKYDILLVDLAMPGLVGCEAARAIRRHEQEDGGVARSGTALPIVALTGRTADDVACECAAAGIDLRLTKPVSPGELLDTVRLLVSLPPAEAQAAAKEAEPALHTPGVGGECADSPFDLGELKEKWGADEAFCRKLLGDFSRRAGDDVACIESALAAGRVETVRALGHSLKGAALYVTAGRIGALAERFEELSEGAATAQAAALVAALRYELRVFDDRFATLLRGEIR